MNDNDDNGNDDDDDDDDDKLTLNSEGKALVTRISYNCNLPSFPSCLCFTGNHSKYHCE